MKTFFDILTYHSAAYPKMTPQDYLKLAFQCEFGCEHLLGDKESAFNYLIFELGSVKFDPNAIPCVDIGGGYSRLDLSAVKGKLSPETVFKIFEMSVSETRNREAFERKLSLTARAARMGIINADANALDACFSGYRYGDIPSHSEEYRAAYDPHYRVISTELARLIPLVTVISERAEQDGYINIAIDGRAASGKSTAAELLSRIFDADVIHMDDFFLPKEKKTPERLLRAGGNIDSERFFEQVYNNLDKSVIEYNCYDCQSGVLGKSVSLHRKRILIVEGVYSLLPDFRDKYCIKVFMDIDKDTQKERLLLRDGAGMLARYLDEWIPLEEKYFSTLAPQMSCDLYFNVAI